jgi:hypothetical protein
VQAVRLSFVIECFHYEMIQLLIEGLTARHFNNAIEVQCGTCEFASSMASIQRQAITPLIVVVVGIVTLVMTFS